MLGAGADVMIGVAKAGRFGFTGLCHPGSGDDSQRSRSLRDACDKPLNLNFFCHVTPVADAQRAQQWKTLFKGYYDELGADFDAPTPPCAV